MTDTTLRGGNRVTGLAPERSNRWVEYRAWNRAVADVIYPMNVDALPAYMDLEEEELQKIATAAGYHGSDAGRALADAVRGVTIMTDGRFGLSALSAETRRWAAQKKAVDPPPCLAFLAVSVLAAEEMGDNQEDLASNAYYARLARLLRLPDDDRSLRQQYPRNAEYLWRCLNIWLENLDGQRGLPTAYALTYRFVGLPMSQALVREGDRRKFPLMFAHFGLSPGMRLAPEDLVRYLDTWLTTEGSSATANLRRLWRRSDSHERIASVAAVELANWDGVVGDETPGTAAVESRAVAVANLRTGFMGSSLDLSLGLRPLTAEMDGAMEVLATDGTWLSLGFSPGTAGLWRTAYSEAIDFRSMLEGVVRIRHAGVDGAPVYKHFPRMVVPLIYDELQSAYLESERLQLGVDALVLVRSSGTTKAAAGAVAEVEQILQEAARPGFQKLDKLTGLPEGWVLFTDVQLFGAPSTSTKYNELVPLARNQLTIAGGLRIPSRIRKWSTSSRPEIRATVQSETHLRVTLSGSMEDDTLFEWDSDSGALVVSLDDVPLGDGDYQVALFTRGKTPIQQASLRLRSSDDVDIGWHDAPRLTYSLDRPLGALSASADSADAALIDGLLAEGVSGVAPTEKATGKVIWAGQKTVTVPTTIKIGNPDPKSCVVTGAHHIQLPPALGGHAPRFIQGECKSCGLVKRYPGWLPRGGWRQNAGKQTTSSATASTVTVEELTAVQEHEVNWDAALDALMHLGGGSISSLESIAMQLEGSALFVDTFIRALESLGHLSIERDECWRPIRWEISPSCLGQVSDGYFKLAGFWPSSLREGLEGMAAAHGGKLAVKKTNAGPTGIFVTGVSDDDALMLGGDDEVPIAIAPEAGLRMLEALPRLSDIALALPRTPMLGFQTAERFDLASASWVSTGDPNAQGAYKIRRGFETTYVYRSKSDVAEGCAATATVHLAKHLAANGRGKTLACYHKESHAVLLPQGCDMPGLYGRAVVAMSGQLPAVRKIAVKGYKRKCLSYSDIDQDSADLLFTLLTT